MVETMNVLLQVVIATVLLYVGVGLFAVVLGCTEFIVGKLKLKYSAVEYQSRLSQFENK